MTRSLIARESEADANHQFIQEMMSSVHAWKKDPSTAEYCSEVLSYTDILSARLLVGAWHKEDVDRARTVLRRIGATLLQDNREALDTVRLSPRVLHVLWRQNWWRDWAADPLDSHKLAHLLLQARHLDERGLLTRAACGIAHQWIKSIQQHDNAPVWWRRTLNQVGDFVLHLVPQQIPTYSGEQVAMALFGPAWVTLYGDLLDNPAQVTQHLREQQPPFVWQVKPNVGQHNQSDLLPKDLAP